MKFAPFPFVFSTYSVKYQKISSLDFYFFKFNFFFWHFDFKKKLFQRNSFLLILILNFFFLNFAPFLSASSLESKSFALMAPKYLNQQTTFRFRLLLPAEYQPVANTKQTNKYVKSGCQTFSRPFFSLASKNSLKKAKTRVSKCNSFSLLLCCNWRTRKTKKIGNFSRENNVRTFARQWWWIFFSINLCARHEVTDLDPSWPIILEQQQQLWIILCFSFF